MAKSNLSSESLKTKILDYPKSPSFHTSNSSSSTQNTEKIEFPQSPTTIDNDIISHNVSVIMRKLHWPLHAKEERTPTSKYKPLTVLHACDDGESPTCKQQLFVGEIPDETRIDPRTEAVVGTSVSTTTFSVEAASSSRDHISASSPTD